MRFRSGARRLPARVLDGPARRAYLAGVFLVMLLGHGASAAQMITEAAYSSPTTRYDHGVLGDAIEWGALTLRFADGTTRRFILPETLVYEDTHPRVVDLDQDGLPEIIVVESSLSSGARLAVYGPSGRLAHTDFIGRRNRWLAPIGAADFTQDGRLEIAMVVTPHLTGTLVILSYGGKTGDKKLKQIARTDGLTNHRIGDRDISGGIRRCSDAPEIILARFPWQRSGRTEMVAVRMAGGGQSLTTASFSALFNGANVTAALKCKIHPTIQ